MSARVATPVHDGVRRSIAACFYGPRSNALALALTCAALALGCSAAGTAAPMDAGAPEASGGPSVTEPTIWVRPSPSLDPRALPLRDQGYVTNAPKRGYVFVCDPRMAQQTNAPAAQQDGDWVHQAAGTYDMTSKLFFQGNVYYASAQFAVTSKNNERLIAGNGFPMGVPTGTFPVAPSDPAYAFDRNPNSVTAQAISFSIPRTPTPAKSASCTYKEVGITLDGVPLHGPLDSTGRDELAHEIQDVCTGGPQPGGGYHRHALSECTPHIHDRNALVGYALDGFGLFSPYDANGKELTTADLDECHGVTSEIAWEGTTVTMYHYVLTRDFPYAVSCFRGTPTRNAFPPLPGAPPQR